jgi:hypothetical protein
MCSLWDSGQVSREQATDYSASFSTSRLLLAIAPRVGQAVGPQRELKPQLVLGVA